MLLMDTLAAQAATNSSKSAAEQTQKVYKSIGPNGQVIYSDKPSPGSEEITVPLTGGYKPVQTPGFTPYQPPRSHPNKQSTNQISITDPADQATIRSAEGVLSVSVNIAQRMQQHQTLVYQVDGKTLYTGTATSRTFNNIFRGTHVVTVMLTNADGSTVSSASATVYMKRPFKKK